MEDTVNRRIALFGGSYDPIHIGHVNMAVHMLEIHKLNCIFFCPAFCSPHKTDNPPRASIADRLKMVELTIEEEPRFKVLDFESKRNSPSYTIDTIEYLKKRYPKSDLYLILSDVSMRDFPKWKDAKKIIEMADVLIGSRNDVSLSMDPFFSEVVKKGITQIPIFEISSSQIRKRLKKRLYCSHLVFSKVLSYIDKKQLYLA